MLKSFGAFDDDKSICSSKTKIGVKYHIEIYSTLLFKPLIQALPVHERRSEMTHMDLVRAFPATAQFLVLWIACLRWVFLCPLP